MSAVDDIQMLLDDHILKAQTMRGSPYVKAFEADMVAWEEKLISMQDILDAWLTVTCFVLIFLSAIIILSYLILTIFSYFSVKQHGFISNRSSVLKT